MARYIDADAFEVVRLPDGASDEFSDGASYILELIDAAPTIDAAPVVRCRECKNWEDGWLGYCTKIHTTIEYNGFCSYGERRSADD